MRNDFGILLEARPSGRLLLVQLFRPTRDQAITAAFEHARTRKVLERFYPEVVGEPLHFVAARKGRKVRALSRRVRLNNKFRMLIGKATVTEASPSAA